MSHSRASAAALSSSTVALGAFAVAVYRHHAFARTTGHVAVAAAGAHVLLLLSFIAQRGFFSLEGTVITAVPALLFAWIAHTGASLAPAEQPNT